MVRSPPGLPHSSRAESIKFLVPWVQALIPQSDPWGSHLRAKRTSILKRGWAPGPPPHPLRGGSRERPPSVAHGAASPSRVLSLLSSLLSGPDGTWVAPRGRNVQGALGPPCCPDPDMGTMASQRLPPLLPWPLPPTAPWEPSSPLAPPPDSPQGASCHTCPPTSLSGPQHRWRLCGPLPLPGGLCPSPGFCPSHLRGAGSQGAGMLLPAQMDPWVLSL